MDLVVILIGLGALVIGVIPLVVFYRQAKEYYTRKPLELPDELDRTAPANIDERPLDDRMDDTPIGR
jgi:hypothetical protein